MAKQTTRHVARIPPAVFHDYPVDIHMRIYREGARYGADIFAVGRSLRIPIEMSPQDLEALNRRLQKEMQIIASDHAERGELTPADLQAQLCSLAEVGHFAFKRVFSHHDALAGIQELLALGQRVSIQVASEDFFIPWELLYPIGVDESLSYDHFWGMNHVVSRIIVQDVRPGAFVSPIMSVPYPPKLGLLAYCSLPGVVEKEIPFFKKLHKVGKITLFKLRALNPEKKQEEFREFKAFWQQTLNLVHFACHAFYVDGWPSLSHILLSDEFPISLEDMEVYGITIYGHPLIILNACGTGNPNPLYTSHFASAFIRYGARGVVATECAVPDAFAADFAHHLYMRLLAGRPLGKSLLATRRYFLEKHHNPSGLLYSMYAPPSIRLVYTEG